MKTLQLIRHAKSDWDDITLSDFDRPLNQRGQQDAPEMGRRIAGKAMCPDLLISSSAVRARTTATLIAATMHYPAEKIVLHDELYMATPSTMLRIIRASDDSIGHLALLAHNPGMTELVERLTRQPFENVPTAGVITLTAPVTSWSEAGCRWNIVDFDYPKKRS
ncbi:histidine phosphatase family protein [Mariprofundus erugo]|uniref:Histidine phosphatase family protein n=1 Tax=Mariprofundus erugo TaxID=2528639 RepID=A0A5R9GWS6_9PROT|nr:histidine phosphatase family protein [Mariprofundus erugo]TLS68507.1 histidine phosphatase family protein [Mariprofundus erugo]TLS76866.1 histidine phosphatase family protein [Mariprofundus erugo]